jgi:phospholipase A-2-activating protein
MQLKVRGICICGGSGIATSSRDRTVRLWTADPSAKHKYSLSKTLAGHTGFVGPLAWLASPDRFPQGTLVSGGMDTQVLLWDISIGEVAERMKGHQYQVTGLTVDDNGDIISSSMDWYELVILFLSFFFPFGVNQGLQCRSFGVQLQVQVLFISITR